MLKYHKAIDIDNAKCTMLYTLSYDTMEKSLVLNKIDALNGGILRLLSHMALQSSLSNYSAEINKSQTLIAIYDKYKQDIYVYCIASCKLVFKLHSSNSISAYAFSNNERCLVIRASGAIDVYDIYAGLLVDSCAIDVKVCCNKYMSRGNVPANSIVYDNVTKNLAVYIPGLGIVLCNTDHDGSVYVDDRWQFPYYDSLTRKLHCIPFENCIYLMSLDFSDICTRNTLDYRQLPNNGGELITDCRNGYYFTISSIRSFASKLPNIFSRIFNAIASPMDEVSVVATAHSVFNPRHAIKIPGTYSCIDRIIVSIDGDVQIVDDGDSVLVWIASDRDVVMIIACSMLLLWIFAIFFNIRRHRSYLNVISPS